MHRQEEDKQSNASKDEDKIRKTREDKQRKEKAG